MHALGGQINYVVNGYKKGLINYSVHSGDLTSYPFKNSSEMKIISTFMGRLDKAGVPNGVLAGNHDVEVNPEASERVYNTSLYTKYFGEKRYNKNLYYGGSYKNNLAHYDLISKGETDYLFLYMSWGLYNEEDYVWADNVIKAHPNRLVVFITHWMRYGSPNASPNYELRDALFDDNPNVIAYMYGHYWNHKGETVPRTKQIIINSNPERTVVEMFYNPQRDDTNGKYGYIRLIEIDPISQKISLKTYSNVNKAYSHFQEAYYVL